MKLKYLMPLVFVFISGCATVPVVKPTPVNPSPTPLPSPTPSPSSTPAPAPTPAPSPTASIQSIAAASSCAAYNWKDRGPGPAGYFEGVVDSYAHSLCRLKANPTVVMAQAVGSPSTDALAWYGITATQGVDALTKMYALAIGEGIRESTGCYNCGYDTTAGTETAEEAEAGAWQTSYNSHTDSTSLDSLFSEYQASSANCYLSDYQVGTVAAGCGDQTTPNRGTGTGVIFQALEKSCPGFAAEYAVTVMRVDRSHYGPLVTKAAEYRPECLSLLQQIQKLVTCP